MLPTTRVTPFLHFAISNLIPFRLPQLSQTYNPQSETGNKLHFIPPNRAIPVQKPHLSFARILQWFFISCNFCHYVKIQKARQIYPVRFPENARPGQVFRLQFFSLKLNRTVFLLAEQSGIFDRPSFLLPSFYFFDRFSFLRKCDVQLPRIIQFDPIWSIFIRNIFSPSWKNSNKLPSVKNQTRRFVITM